MGTSVFGYFTFEVTEPKPASKTELAEGASARLLRSARDLGLWTHASEPARG